MTVAAAGLIAATAPMNDEYAGNSGETEKSQESESQSSSGSDSSSKRKSTTSDKKDTGNYKDGTYSINGQYGPVGEDSIDVHLTIADQKVDKVAGASWTSDAFNKALEVARQEASIQ